MALEGRRELPWCFRWVHFRCRGTGADVENTESSALTQELQGLEALEYQMSKNAEALRQRRENARFATTLKGRVFAIVGRGFAIYCVFRIISVSLDPSPDESYTQITDHSLLRISLGLLVQPTRLQHHLILLPNYSFTAYHCSLLSIFQRTRWLQSQDKLAWFSSERSS